MKNTYADPARDHLPDMTTVDGVVDLFALCILGNLCNILDHRTYQCGPHINQPSFIRQFHVNDDANNISTEERRKCIRTRGLAYDLGLWLFGAYRIIDSDTQQTMTWATLFAPHIAQVTATIILYLESHKPDDQTSCEETESSDDDKVSLEPR